MIKRIQIDNYRCFSNFEWAPSQFALLLGENGAGKTSMFDVLESLRDIITKGHATDEIFPANTLCKWREERDGLQTFGLSVEGNGGEYVYRLQIQHELPKLLKNRISLETLFFNGQAVFEFDGKDIHLFRDDGSAGPVFPFDWSRSGIATVPERHDNTRLTWFRDRIAAISVFSPDPPAMDGVVRKAVTQPDRSMQNFAAWLFGSQSADFEIGGAVAASLRASIKGFSKHRFIRVGSSGHELQIDFEFRDDMDKVTNRFELSFDALSEGQRNLFALYSILHASVRPGATVCIDEPDNYVALREIQPWLAAIQDAAEDHDCQVFMVSHHPEMINQLAAHSGTLFERDASGTTACRKFVWEDGENVTPAELVARGWE